MANGGLSFVQGIFVVAAAIGVAGVVCVPELVFGKEDAQATSVGLSVAYNGSIPAYVDVVNKKYDGAVPADDAAIIAYAVCQAYDADPATAYLIFTAKATASGMSADRAAYMTRTAVETVCPRHRSHLP